MRCRRRTFQRPCLVLPTNSNEVGNASKVPSLFPGMRWPKHGIHLPNRTSPPFTGPWKGAWVLRGYDPRREPAARGLQTLQYQLPQDWCGAGYVHSLWWCSAWQAAPGRTKLAQTLQQFGTPQIQTPHTICVPYTTLPGGRDWPRRRPMRPTEAPRHSVLLCRALSRPGRICVGCVAFQIIARPCSSWANWTPQISRAFWQIPTAGARQVVR